MKHLMQELGNPQDSLQFVHVVGTNGKGSVVTMLSSVLAQAGYKTGANISPYVLGFTERFMINGEQIQPARLAELITQVRAAAERLDESIIEFEAVTAVALLYFAAEKCDIVCLEAGMGGGNDSTNVIQNTLVACIMRVGLDHTAILGDTVQAIAAEKSGVIKNGCTVVSYPNQRPEAMQEIARKAREQQCPHVIPDVAQLVTLKAGAFENLLIYKDYKMRVPFAGQHQALNATVVVEAALALRQRGYHLTDEHIIKGIEAARFPARIEILRRAPLVILDGAHNEDSVQALAQTLEAGGAKNLAVVMGVLQDKDWRVMLETLSPFIGKLYPVTPDSPRALPANMLAAQAREYVAQVEERANMDEALAAALASGADILVCGSLYLAAEARIWLLNNL